jgi:protein-S-isoprenylcysteine O-methyltransferase Ste14
MPFTMRYDGIAFLLYLHQPDTPLSYMTFRFDLGKWRRLFLLLTVLIGMGRADAEDRDMVLEGLDGDVTTNEYQSFIAKLNYLPPPPTNNVGNLMVDEKDGARLHGMQTFYAFTHDRCDLDMAIVWSDAFLHARNDPTNGRIIWTGKRGLCWPNKDTNEVQSLHAGAENGDVIEHIVNTARLILENPAVWNQTAPPDRFGFGATYLDRAKTYVRECQRSAETTIVPWFVRSTKNGFRLYHPDSPAYFKCCGDSGPVPWNQQQAIVGGLLRLAQCHRLLHDGNTNTAYYEKITADAAAWFFASALPVSAHNRVCYQWTYVAPRDPADWPEVATESDYDMFIFRAFQANLGPTRLQMQRLINTARFVMYLGTNRIAGKVNGTSNAERHERQFLEFEWIEMSVLDREFYHLVADTVLTSHEYWDNIAVEAAVLSAKHYWAKTANPPPEIIEDAKGIPPVPQISNYSPRQLKRWPPAAILMMFWGISELLLNIFKRSKSNAVSKDHHSLKLILVVNVVACTLGVMAAYRLPAFHIHLGETGLAIGWCLFVPGLVLRWWAIIYLGRLFTTNVAIATDHRLIDSGPYRFIRHPSYAGSLLALLGFTLCIPNWASWLLIFLPCCVVTLWRIHIEEQALIGGLGEPYRSYMRQTRRLIPWIF